MYRSIVALFGEAEKGEFQHPYFCKTIPQLADTLGQPPKDSKGLFYAIQTLFYHQELVFFRVREEGFSLSDYFFGLKALEEHHFEKPLAAICTPGMGDPSVIEVILPLCTINHSIFITTEADLYDYLMLGSR